MRWCGWFACGMTWHDRAWYRHDTGIIAMGVPLDRLCLTTHLSDVKSLCSGWMGGTWRSDAQRSCKTTERLIRRSSALLSSHISSQPVSAQGNGMLAHDSRWQEGLEVVKCLTQHWSPSRIPVPYVLLSVWMCVKHHELYRFVPYVLLSVWMCHCQCVPAAKWMRVHTRHVSTRSTASNNAAELEYLRLWD